VSLECSNADKHWLDFIYGDKNRYEQILLNLISNSLKFSNQGGIVKVVLELKNVEPVSGMTKSEFGIMSELDK
jgi:signal transduction histidine kinase